MTLTVDRQMFNLLGNRSTGIFVMISEVKENARQDWKRIRNNDCGGGGDMLPLLCRGGMYDDKRNVD